MLIGRFKIQPREVHRINVGYSKWLADGETLSLISTEVSPTTETPFEIASVVMDVDSKGIAMLLGGGEDGEIYKITVLATTTQGQVKEDEIEFHVQEL